MKRLISLLLLFCIGLPLLAQQQRPAQTPKRDQKKKEVAEFVKSRIAERMAQIKAGKINESYELIG